MAEFTFKTKSGKTAILTIEGATVSSACCLAADPIVVDVDKSNDLFTPIRTQSGNINIVGEVSDLEGIICDSPIDRPVTLKISNVTAWKGFLQGGGYTQDWVKGPNKISIPIVSPLCLLDSIYPSSDNLGYIKIRELIGKISAALGSPWDSIQYPKACTSAKEYMFSLNNYAEFDEATGTYQMSSYREILEDVCKLFGWQIIENGSVLYISMYGRETIPSMFSTFGVSKADHTIDYILGKRKVKTTMKVNKVLGNFYTFEPKNACTAERFYPHSYIVDGEEYAVSVDFKPTKGIINLYNNMPSYIQVNNVKLDDLGSERVGYYGATWNSDYLVDKEGETLRFNIKNFDTSRNKVIELNCPRILTTWDNQVGNMGKYGQNALVGLALCASVNYTEYPGWKYEPLGEDDDIEDFLYIQIGATATINGVETTKFAYSNIEYEWSNTPNIIAAPIKNGKLKNKDFPDAEGFIFMVPHDLVKAGAKIKIVIMTQGAARLTPSMQGIRKYVSLSDVSLKNIEYKDSAYYQISDKEEKSTEYTIGNGFLEDYNVDTNLMADPSLSLISIGNILSSTGGTLSYTDLFPDAGVGVERNGCAFIERIKEYYSKPRKIINATIDGLGNITPRQCFAVENGGTFICLGKTINFRDESVKGQFFELP